MIFALLHLANITKNQRTLLFCTENDTICAPSEVNQTGTLE